MILNYLSRYHSNFLFGEQESNKLYAHDKFISVFNLPYESHTVAW
jgi:hypothetical protein